jgi:putative nucleotidyltransferase with HDIG domain
VKKRILFVDDEPNVLEGLERMLHGMRKEWSLNFAQSAIDALKMMEEEEFDVVVSDIRMPHMNGIEFLTQVQTRFPKVIRIVLSGQSKQEHILPSVGLAHQYLSKPSSCDELKSTVARVSTLGDELSNPALQAIVAKIGTLPSLPSIQAELVTELHSETCSMQRIGEIVSRDVGMTAKLLQLVNSSFFGLPHRVSTAAQAVQYLGVETVRALIFSYQAISTYEQKVPKDFSLTALWKHSLQVGLTARNIASKESTNGHTVNDAWTAGLLHDIGKLMLASAAPHKWKLVEELAEIHGKPIWVAEKSIFGASHAEVGACLLRLWGLPDGIVEAVAYHHRPLDCMHQDFGALTALYAAEIVEAHDAKLIEAAESDEYLTRHGLATKLASFSDARADFGARAA